MHCASLFLRSSPVIPHGACFLLARPLHTTLGGRSIFPYHFRLLPRSLSLALSHHTPTSIPVLSPALSLALSLPPPLVSLSLSLSPSLPHADTFSVSLSCSMHVGVSVCVHVCVWVCVSLCVRLCACVCLSPSFSFLSLTRSLALCLSRSLPTIFLACSLTLTCWGERVQGDKRKNTRKKRMLIPGSQELIYW